MLSNEHEARASQLKVAEASQDEMRKITGGGQARDAEDVTRILRKIDASDRTQAAVWAVRKELV